MKALTIRHPWVDLILAGTKTVEVRGWATRYRGPLLLHAAHQFGIAEREAASRFRVALPEAEARGAIVGIAELVDCRPILRQDWKKACLPPLEGKLWAWVLEDARPIGPIPYGGRRMLFDVDEEVLTEAAAAS
jgi:hypothetical protein